MEGLLDDTDLTKRMIQAMYRVAPGLGQKIPPSEFPKDALQAAMRIVRAHAKVSRDVEWTRAFENEYRLGLTFLHPRQYAAAVRKTLKPRRSTRTTPRGRGLKVGVDHAHKP